MNALNVSRAAGALAIVAVASGTALAQAQAPDLQPLPEPKFNAAMADLGRYLFFDERMSGDAALSCASCHDPKKGWGDGQALGLTAGEKKALVAFLRDGLSGDAVIVEKPKLPAYQARAFGQN